MKRRTILRNAAAGTAATAGVASAASAATLGDADGPYTFAEENGRRTVKAVADLDDDVELQDHCHVYCCEDCADTGCGDDCVWEVCCNL